MKYRFKYPNNLAYEIQRLVLIYLKVTKLSAYSLKILFNDSVMTGHGSLKWMCH